MKNRCSTPYTVSSQFAFGSTCKIHCSEAHSKYRYQVQIFLAVCDTAFVLWSSERSFILINKGRPITHKIKIHLEISLWYSLDRKGWAKLPEKRDDFQYFSPRRALKPLAYAGEEFPCAAQSQSCRSSKKLRSYPDTHSSRIQRAGKDILKTEPNARASIQHDRSDLKRPPDLARMKFGSKIAPSSESWS